MADFAGLTSQELFDQWRKGDAEAGAAMAQRFSDWYYAITVARLGDEGGRGPMERSCSTFQQGILNVAKPSQLVDWAHQIVQKEVAAAGNRAPGSDHPNQLTRNQSPRELIRSVADKLPAADVALLNKTYNGGTLDDVAALAENSGGMPLAVYQARHALREALVESGITFTSAPDPDNEDWGPVPLYEAGKLRAPYEENAFERWMLHDATVCREVAEFSAFAHALRAGALEGIASGDMALPSPKKVAPAKTAAPTTKAPDAASAPADDDVEWAPGPRFTATHIALAVGVGFVLLLVVALGLVAMLR